MVKFHVTDWTAYHEEDDEGGKSYTVRLFGKTEEPDNKSIFVKAVGFSPYFFIQVPDQWRSSHARIFMDEIKERVWKGERDTLKGFKLIKRKRFRGFTKDKKFNFIRLSFTSVPGFRAYERILRNKVYVNGLHPKMQSGNRKYPLYESNIEPLLRLMHIRKVAASGWIEIDETHAKEIDGESISELNYEVNWQRINPVNKTAVSPLKIAAFDIECTSIDGSFPQAKRDGDKVIMIGTTYSLYGQDECYRKHISTLGSCSPIDGVEVSTATTEKGMFLNWRQELEEQDPDVVLGWNNFGFDEKYMNDRALKIGAKNFFFLSRLKGYFAELKEKKLSSAALGDNELHYFDMIGRVHFDLMKVVQRDYKLMSYTLDYAASYFIREDIGSIDVLEKPAKRNGKKCNMILHAKSTKGIKPGDCISITHDDGISMHTYGENFTDESDKKFKVIDIEGNDIWTYQKNQYHADLHKLVALPANKWAWAQAKDDIKPADIFRLFKGTADDRAIIAKYCIQDCALCNRLVNKLQVLNNMIGMSNVCTVPLSYLFLRGQGVKGTSLVAKRCRERGYLIPVLDKPPVQRDENGNEIEPEKGPGYEGAYVLEPTPGVYYEPITVLDYSSLYPKSIIHRNMSHETIVEGPEYDNLPDHVYYEAFVRESDGSIKRCRYAINYTTMKKGVIPEILEDLLNAREETKAKMKAEQDPFVKAILNGLQNAFKITANSLYGLIGASTSAVYYREIAASTTATGRDMLDFAIRTVKKNFPGAEIIYGDTDSIFIKFLILDENGKRRTDKGALIESIRLGALAEAAINEKVPYPHKIVNEKTMWPFCIISKKRYFGDKWESVDKCERISMGIVLKRRDNAMIVKDIYGGVIHRIMDMKSTTKAVQFIKKSLIKILNNKYPIDRFTISKTLRSTYKEPDKIAHCVLAKRMGERDPGNKPRTNDRIKYAYVRIDKDGKMPKHVLQSERVEHPDYIKEKGLKLDYLFYITNQIQKPVVQFLELILKNPKKIFQQVIYKEMNRRKGVASINHWVKRADSDADPMDMDMPELTIGA
jgi:DNA polymerase elongation subunit (family B)